MITKLARLVTDICGERIQTIPKGTEFRVIVPDFDCGYCACVGIDATFVYNDEFEIIETTEE